MHAAPGHLRSVGIPPVPPEAKDGDGESVVPALEEKHSGRDTSLSWLESVLGFSVFVVWLALFGGGILVDTEPHRIAISPEGASRLRDEGRVPESTAKTGDAASPAPRAPVAASRSHWARSWFVVLTCFLPLNLAWLCLSSSTLGAVGNLANLSDDHEKQRSPDTSNPLMSAVLRGFFVYLFLMSGLLVLDNAPFSNAGPSQYIRLAGFLSLFSFVVSYQPHLFSSLILSAFERIQVRAGDSKSQTITESEHEQAVVRHTTTKTIERETQAQDHVGNVS